VFDATINGNLQFGSGSKGEDRVMNWNQKAAAVIWPVRVSKKSTFDVAINYDAPGASRTKKVEGDVGKEIAPAHNAAGGTYAVQIGAAQFTGVVRSGNQVTDALGSVVLEPGNYEIRVSAQDIAGVELMRLRKLTLTPVTD